MKPREQLKEASHFKFGETNYEPREAVRIWHKSGNGEDKEKRD